MTRLTEEMIIARSKQSDLTAIKKLNCWCEKNLERDESSRRFKVTFHHILLVPQLEIC